MVTQDGDNVTLQAPRGEMFHVKHSGALPPWRLVTQDGDNVTLCQAPRGRTFHVKRPGRAAAVAPASRDPASREAPGEGAESPLPRIRRRTGASRT